MDSLRRDLIVVYDSNAIDYPTGVEKVRALLVLQRYRSMRHPDYGCSLCQLVF